MMPQSLISSLFSLARLSSGDTFVDLGCGDGTVVIQAAHAYGVRAGAGAYGRRFPDSVVGTVTRQFSAVSAVFCCDYLRVLIVWFISFVLDACAAAFVLTVACVL